MSEQQEAQLNCREDGRPFWSRKGEEVGGGFFIFRRGRKANRIKPGKIPFEHPSLEAALAERARLYAKHPDIGKLVIMQEVRG